MLNYSDGTCKLSTSCKAECLDCQGYTDSDTDAANPVDITKCRNCIQGYYVKDNACVQHDNC